MRRECFDWFEEIGRLVVDSSFTGNKTVSISSIQQHWYTYLSGAMICTSLCSALKSHALSFLVYCIDIARVDTV